MPRVTIELPEYFPFSTEISVRVSDVNYAGHLGNDSVLSLAHEARIRFLASHGFSEFDAGGAGMVMSDAAVVYKTQAFQGERLRVDVAVADFTRVGCDVYFRMVDISSGRDVAHVKTGIVFFDFATSTLVRTPAVFREKVSNATK